MASPAPAKSASFSASDKEELVYLLHRAAEIEHVLLNAYLYAATSIKSTPQEFADPHQPNPRRAIQFEKARRWKQTLTQVARQEMMHLHFVQLMLRTLGEAPYFGLPQRSEAGGWVIEHWEDQAAGVSRNSVDVDLAKASADAIMRFAAYECGDEVQDEGLRSEAWQNRFEKLLAFEQELGLEQTLYRMPEGEARQALMQRLRDLYGGAAFTPDSAAPTTETGAPVPPSTPGDVFQSIGDLYRLRILPLFEKAFAADKVTHSNQVLQNILQGIQTSDHDVIPFSPQPVLRNSVLNMYAPMASSAQVGMIINEIAEEGEGAKDFRERTDAMLKALASPDAVRNYAGMQLRENRLAIKELWFAPTEKIRNSHLYLFALTAKSMEQEARLSGQAGAFAAAREPLSIDGSPELASFNRDLAAHFNACYLAVYTWLARLYLHQGHIVNDGRRIAVSMLTAWPLMSTAIRPLMELLSFFPVDPRSLFWVDNEPGATLTPEARQLATTLRELTGNIEIDEPKIDEQVIQIFCACAGWAASQEAALSRLSFAAPHLKQMILTRLSLLSDLKEVKQQLPFRIQGGYSEILPGPSFLARTGNAKGYEEDAKSVPTLFQKGLVLRFRFAGWALMPMATDPDPPTDEAGCTGTFMLHAADQRVFDRAMRWQSMPGENNILREPRSKLPEIGVNGVEVALMASANGVTAGYAAIPVSQTITGIQSNRAQKLAVSGLSEVATIPGSGILGGGRKLRFNLEDKSGLHPHLVGQNHVVWHDGEPLDPFVLGVHADPEQADGEPRLVLRREVFGEGKRLLDMTPLERIYSARWPISRQINSSGSIPAWALPKEAAVGLDDEKFPSYLAARAALLQSELTGSLNALEKSQGATDEAVSLAERLRLVATPTAATVVWLGASLNYGHTLSGAWATGDGLGEVLKAVEAKTGLKLQLAPPPDGDSRASMNSRWLAGYSLAAMDTDALSHLAYGELYVPVVAAAAGPFRFAKQWKLPTCMSGALAEYACHFERPFWGDYRAVNGTSRMVTVNTQAVTETLRQPAATTGYQYDVSGLAGVYACEGMFSLSVSGEQAELRWSITAEIDQDSVANQVATISGIWAEQMGVRLKAFFQPASQVV